jgi:hypothetical protein
LKKIGVFGRENEGIREPMQVAMTLSYDTKYPALSRWEMKGTFPEVEIVKLLSVSGQTSPEIDAGNRFRMNRELVFQVRLSSTLFKHV